MATLFTALLILVPAPTGDAPPPGAPPRLQYVKYVNGKFETNVIVNELVTIQKTVAVQVNGQAQAQVVTETVAVPVAKTIQMDAANAAVHGADGKPVDEKEWKERLGKGAVVLISDEGKVPDPAYLKPLKDGTLIVVFKQPANTAPPLPK